MTSPAPQTLRVVLHEEHSAGRITVELDTFVRFNLSLDRQLGEFEDRSFERWPRRKQAPGARRKPR
ncbi:MAG: hypothetical protein WD872_11135 [Pirellulaceae bacterium]